MQINTQELDRVAAVETTRFDMYTGIHKAMRAMMADTLLAVGRMDAQDDRERTDVADRVGQLLGMCESHLLHENSFVHPAIQNGAPGASDAVAQEHEEHRRHIGVLADRLAALLDAAPAQREAAALVLYRGLSLFIADNLQHMHAEETMHNAVLWASYSDAELVAIHDELLASIPPEEMMAVARWLLPFISPLERQHLLADMRAKAPPAAFDAMLATARPHLTQREWQKLSAALALA